MQTLTRKQFDKRWQAAQQKTRRPMEAKVTLPEINLSLGTLLGNYATQVRKAAQAHAITDEQCQALCTKLEELRTLAAPLESSMKPFLKL